MSPADSSLPRSSLPNAALPDAAFLARLARAWPQLQAPSLEVLSGGLLHQTWRVMDSAGDFILQRVSAVFSPGVHDNVDAVTAHLEARAVPCFRLVRTGEGSLLWRDGGFDHRLMTLLPGRAHETCPGPMAARSAAGALARFHSALADFDSPLAPLGFAYREPALSYADLERVVAARADHPLHGDVASLAREVLRLRSLQTRDEGLPQRVIHGDLKFSNVLFVESAVVPPPGEAHALIDLDTVMRRPVYHDLGDAWRSWCNRHPEDDPVAELDLTVFEAVAEGYLEALEFELSTAERASLVDALERLALELSARFLTDALEERWFGFDADRYARSGLHQLDRARGQLSLHAQACDGRGRIRECLTVG